MSFSGTYLTDGDETEVREHASKIQSVKVLATRLTDGKEFKFITQSAAARALKVNIARVSECSRGLRVSSGGYSFQRY
jgi:hypothetical protein